jgi:hypothetical protein
LFLQEQIKDIIIIIVAGKSDLTGHNFDRSGLGPASPTRAWGVDVCKDEPKTFVEIARYSCRGVEEEEEE